MTLVPPKARPEKVSVVDSAEISLRSWLGPGNHRPGDRLPPEQEIAAMLGISRGTLRLALERLSANGEIVRSGSRTTPGKFGALASRLLNYLDKSHHGVELTPMERRRITLWLDCNGNEFGAYIKLDEQRHGAIVWPGIDCDPHDPLGTEWRSSAQ